MIPAMAVAEEYARRLAVREAEVARLAKVHERIGNGRVALGVAVLVVAWAVLFERALAPVWLLVPVAAFSALVLYHSSVRGKRVSADRAADYYRHGIARLEDRWIGLGERGERFGATASDDDVLGRKTLAPSQRAAGNLLSQLQVALGVSVDVVVRALESRGSGEEAIQAPAGQQFEQ